EIHQGLDHPAVRSQRTSQTDGRSRRQVAAAGGAGRRGNRRRLVAAHSGESDSVWSKVNASCAHHPLGSQGERTDHHRARSQRPGRSGNRSRARIDESHRADRRHRSFGGQSLQVPRGNSRRGLHADAASSDFTRGPECDRSRMARKRARGANSVEILSQDWTRTGRLLGSAAFGVQDRCLWIHHRRRRLFSRHESARRNSRRRPRVHQRGRAFVALCHPRRRGSCPIDTDGVPRMNAEGKNESAIRLRDLSKSFGAQPVLSGINLRVRQGETVAVLGRSGTGKSVMLKLIVGLQKPDRGKIEIGGKEITSLTLEKLNEVRRTIGFLFQSAALYDSLAVEENVAFPLKRHSRLNDDERRKKVRELLERVGMEKAAAKMPSDISGGMKKRVGLARAIALDPEIMLLDEPTAGLDPITATEINDLIRQSHGGRRISAIVVTHDLRSVKAVADRVALLNEGKILIDGTFEDLRESREPFVVKFLKGSKEEM